MEAGNVLAQYVPAKLPRLAVEFVRPIIRCELSDLNVYALLHASQGDLAELADQLNIQPSLLPNVVGLLRWAVGSGVSMYNYIVQLLNLK